MNRKNLGILALSGASLIASAVAENAPNFVVIFTDDQGYGDLGCYGNPTIKTPNIDQMATEGCKFTQFYVASSVCSPSRAALMTGCYPKRVGLHKHVLFPHSQIGLNPDETTVAEVLKYKGYATACIGKWHLGHNKKFMPRNHGFDYHFGYPYSNDMKPLPLKRNEEVLSVNADQSNTTKMFTEEAVKFIERSKDKPFFLYFAHSQPHLPLFCSDDFKGKSARGKYGDSIEEIDWSVGQVLKSLKKFGIDENTFVIFTSDNGPWKVYKTRGGSVGPLRGEKGTTLEGGQRVPCIVRWPGKVPAATTCSKVVTAMDILPTITKLANGTLPTNKIDGEDISSLMFNPLRADQNEKTFFYYTAHGAIDGIRKGAMKYCRTRKELYNLHEDIGEEWNLYKTDPTMVAEMEKLLSEFDARMTKEARPVGTL